MQRIWNKISKKRLYLLLLLPLAIYFYFGLNHLTQFETADEHYWIYSGTNNDNYWTNSHGRIWQYWHALAKGDLAQTRINDKPGVTLAYVSGIGSYWRTNLKQALAAKSVAPLSKMEKAQKVNFYFRLPLLIFNGLFSIVLLYLIKKLTKNDWVGLLAVSLMLLSPILLGISQIINPDALLWSFAFSSLLSFLIFLPDKSKKYALWTAVFLGLALLSKYSAIILVPFFFVVMLAYLFERVAKREEAAIAQDIIKYALAYFGIIAGAFLIYAVMMPDNLINPAHFMQGTYGFKGLQLFFLFIFTLNLLPLLDGCFFKSNAFLVVAKKLVVLNNYFQFFVFFLMPIIFSLVIFNALAGNDWLGLFRFSFNSPSSLVFRNLSIGQIFLMQFLPLTFSISPMVIIILLSIWVRNLKKTNSHFHWIVFVFSFFILVFVIASMQQKVLLSSRYSIMLYPPMLTMAAIGIQDLFSLDRRKAVFQGGIFLSLIVLGIFTLKQTEPFYLDYTNAFLPKKYSITDAWGYGGYEAAAYLNSLPEATNMHIWTDYNGVCVFFNGNCKANRTTLLGIIKKAKLKNQARSVDYYVSTRKGKMLSSELWSNLEENYDLKLEREYLINQDQNNFIKIYKVASKE